MSYVEVTYPKDKKEFYAMLIDQLKLYIGDESDKIACLSTFSSVLKQAFNEANWVGFYLVDGNELVVGPYQGRPAVRRIGYGQGVCGTAWKENKAQVVKEVAFFIGHIACDCNTHSEIVIPLKTSDGDIWGVLDMDSVTPAYFTDDDRLGLEECITCFFVKPTFL